MRKYKGKVIIQFDLNFNYVNTFDSSYDASRNVKVAQSSIYSCAKFWSMGCDKEEYQKKYSNNPRKQAGGYIWRFYSDFKNKD